MVNFSFDADPKVLLDPPSTPSRVRGSPSPTRSIVKNGDTSMMDIDDEHTGDLSADITKSPKKLPKDFFKKASKTKSKRLVSVCQMYFLDYYCDMFDYVISRRERTRQVINYLEEQRRSELMDSPTINNEWQGYLTKETNILRKRRLKPKHKDFEMITQVGQGGYGQVYLARKKDTKEICALKILNKKLLMKLEGTDHVLTERDILTTTRSEWLVKLLYACLLYTSRCV